MSTARRGARKLSPAVAATKELRDYLGITQEQLADRVGTHWVTINAHEGGRKEFTAKILNALAEVALAEGRDDIARVFIEEFRAMWHPAMCENLQGKDDPKTAEYITLFRDVLRREPKLAEALTAWLDLYKKRNS